MREQELEQLAKEEAEAVEQFKREQDLFETKVLLGDSKAKVGLSFMYDAPAGLKQVILPDNCALEIIMLVRSNIELV